MREVTECDREGLALVREKADEVRILFYFYHIKFKLKLCVKML